MVNPAEFIPQEKDPRNEEREQAIKKFGNFIKDIPFMTRTSATTEALIEDPETTKYVWGFLQEDAALVMLDRHSFMIESGSDEGPVEFERIDARSGQNSRHGVFFGSVFSQNYHQEVAVKLFDENQGGVDSALTEVVKTAAIRGEGYKTFKPVALGSYLGAVYSLWELERGVTTFDSTDWSGFAEDPSKHPGMRAMMEKSARRIAEIHAKGWSHGDYNPRNVALDLAGRVFPIDWETASLDGSTEEDPETRFQKSYMDISTFMTGCFYDSSHFNSGIGIFSETDNNTALELFDELFMCHYLDERQKQSTSPSELGDINGLVGSLRELPEMIR